VVARRALPPIDQEVAVLAVQAVQEAYSIYSVTSLVIHRPMAQVEEEEATTPESEHKAALPTEEGAFLEHGKTSIKQ